MTAPSALNRYDNSGALRKSIVLDYRFEDIHAARKALTEIEYELMEPEPCDECVKMRAFHLVAMLERCLNLREFGDALYHPILEASPAPGRADDGAPDSL